MTSDGFGFGNLLDEALRVRRMNRGLRGVNYETMPSDEVERRRLINHENTTIGRTNSGDEEYENAADQAREYLKKNHPDLHNYITRQAPVPIDPVMAARDAKNMGSQRVLNMIKDFVRRDTRNIYGKDFPIAESFESEVIQQLSEAFDPDRTWKQYGEAIAKKLTDEKVTHPDSEDHREKFETALRNADPTPHGAYSTWLSNRYAKGGINRLEDFDRARVALTSYHRAKLSKILPRHDINPDIGSFKSLPELESAVDRLPQKEEPKYKPPTNVSDSERTKMHHDGWTQTIPHTWDASCKYGAGTKWCTQGEWGPKYFNQYMSENPRLHILAPDNPSKDEKGRSEKYQLHYGSSSNPNVQFMNPKDESVHPRDVFKDRPLSDEHRAMIAPSIEHAMKHGYDINDVGMYFIDRPTANKWVASDSPALRKGAAMAGHREHLEKLVNDSNPEVRAAVAGHNHPDLLAKLVDDPSIDVRKNVALHNNKPLLDKLANDPSPQVRLNVLNHGHEDHIDAMIDSLLK